MVDAPKPAAATPIDAKVAASNQAAAAKAGSTPVIPVVGSTDKPTAPPVVPAQTVPAPAVPAAVAPAEPAIPPTPPTTDDLVAVAKAARQKQGFAPDAASSIAETDVKSEDAPKQLHEQVGRDLDEDPRGIVDGAFKVDQAGTHIVDASPGEIVSDDSPDQTLAKGLTSDGSGSNGMVPGDAIPT